VRRLGERGLVDRGGVALTVGYTGLRSGELDCGGTIAIALVGAGFYMLHTTVQIHVTQVAPEERGSAVALFATFLFLGQASGCVARGAHRRRRRRAAGLPVCRGGSRRARAAFRYFLSGGGGT
jgi:hypothetical protein